MSDEEKEREYIRRYFPDIATRLISAKDVKVRFERISAQTKDKEERLRLLIDSIDEDVYFTSMDVAKVLDVLHSGWLKLKLDEDYIAKGILQRITIEQTAYERLYPEFVTIYKKLKRRMTGIPETKVPEGVTMVKFEFLAEVDAKVAEDMFEVMIAEGAEFRSAVNMGTMVRTVMYPKGSKTGSPIRMVTKDKDTAWSLQQTIDWHLRDIIDVVAVKKEGVVVEAAYIKKGLKVPPPKEKMIYTFKKTDEWTIKGEEKFK